MSDIELRDDDGAPVTDRRRFNPDGTPRDPGPAAAGDLPDEPGLSDLADAPPDVPPAVDWERRARDAEAKLGELADAFRRGRDELAAVRARLERDQEQRVRDAVGRTLEKVLAGLDSLDRALSHAPDGPLADGVRLAQKQLLDALAAEGLERIRTVGLPFDPNVAEAVAATPASDAPPQTVVEEFRPGYRMGDRILRPAQVRVAL
jgi:molecular chaperone GrpE